MGQVIYNPATGQYEVQDAIIGAMRAAGVSPQQQTQQTSTTATQQQAVNPTVQPTTKTAQPTTKVETSEKTVTDTPRLDTDALDAANKEAIQAQRDAAAAEQAAYKSSIDQYNDMVRGWQEEAKKQQEQQADAEKRARVSMLVSGLAEGVAALTNLYYTTKGSPNIQIHSGLEKYQGIYDRAQQRRDQLRRELNLKLERGGLTLAQMRQQQAMAKAKSDAGIGAAEAQAKAAKIKGDYDNAVAAQSRADKQAEIARAQGNADRAFKLQEENAKESRRHNRAMEARAAASGKDKSDAYIFQHNGKSVVLPSKVAASLGQTIYHERLKELERQRDAEKPGSTRLLGLNEEIAELKKSYGSEKSMAEYAQKYFSESPTTLEMLFGKDEEEELPDDKKWAIPQNKNKGPEYKSPGTPTQKSDKEETIDFDDPRFDSPTKQDPYSNSKRK